MSAANAGKKYLLIPAWILILAMVALGVVQSGKPTNLVEPSGFLFVLVGGIALLMISFPGNEILRALRDAFRSQGNETDIRASAHFWEAAGRSFLIVGVLRSILHLVMFLFSLRTHETGSIVWIIKELAQYLLAALYGILLAVI
jgi:flagellar motor component MotA